MKQRKHIRADILLKMREEVKLGVPIARSMSKHLPPGDITRPTVVMLLKVLDSAEALADDEVEKHNRLMGSVYPDWLNVMGDAVQEQPYEYDYVGTFPDGRYVCRT